MRERLLARTEREGECLIWTGALNSDGYPRMLFGKDTNCKVHRLMYELTTGENIEGLVIRHICDQPKCINPDHLISGTHRDNMEDRQKRGRTHLQVTHEEADTIKQMRFDGLTYQEIADSLNIKRKRVEYILTRITGG